MVNIVPEPPIQASAAIRESTSLASISSMLTDVRQGPIALGLLSTQSIVNNLQTAAPSNIMQSIRVTPHFDSSIAPRMSNMTVDDLASLSNEQRFNAALKLSMEDDDRSMYYLAENVNRFNLTSKQKYECAKKILEKKPCFMRHIESFNLDLKHRFDLAMHIVVNEIAPHFAGYLEHFHLNNEQRFNVAKILTNIKFNNLGVYIEKFGLSHEQRLEIASLLAKKHPEQVAAFIEKFGLAHKHRLELALYMAENKTKFLAIYIEDFLLDQDQYCLVAQAAFNSVDINELKISVSDFYKNNVMSEDMLERCIKVAEKLSTQFHPDMKNKPEIMQSLIKAVINWRNDSQFEMLVGLIGSFEGYNDFFKFYDEMKPHGELTSLILWPLVQEHWAKIPQSERNQISCCFAHRELKDSARMIPVMQFLFSLSEGDKLPFEQLKHIMLRLSDNSANALNTKLTKTEFKKFIKNIPYATMLITLKKRGLVDRNFQIQKLKSLNEISECLKKCTAQLLQLPASEFVSDAIADYFETARQPEALLSYAVTHFKSAPDIKQGISTYAKHVIVEKDFSTYRYYTDNNYHLRVIKETNMLVYNRWANLDQRGKPSAIKADAIENTHASKLLTESPLEYLKNRIINFKHWQPSQCQSLAQVLRGEVTPQEALNTLHIQSKHNKESVKFEENLIQLVGADKEKLQFQKLTWLCKNIPKNLPEQFKRDLVDLRAKLNPNAKKSKAHSWYVEISDTADDLLLCGTEIAGSCQRVDGDPELNNGLLGYLLDGKVKLLTVKNTKDNIQIARQIIRLLLDTNNNPVLHADQLYAQLGVQEEHTNRMQDMLTSYASWLEVDIVDDNEMERYPLQSLGGPAAYEYVDAADGVHQHGKYEITE